MSSRPITKALLAVALLAPLGARPIFADAPPCGPGPIYSGAELAVCTFASPAPIEPVLRSGAPSATVVYPVLRPTPRCTPDAWRLPSQYHLIKPDALPPGTLGVFDAMPDCR